MSEKTRGRKAGIKTAPEGETKADKFKRLGNKRLAKVQKSMKQLRNLSGSGYEYNQAQVDTIVTTLEKAVENIKDAFSGKVEVEETVTL